MEVIGPDGTHIGTVDRCVGDRIVLASEGGDQSVPLSLVQAIDGNRVRLRARGDTDFGLEA